MSVNTKDLPTFVLDGESVEEPHAVQLKYFSQRWGLFGSKISDVKTVVSIVNNRWPVDPAKVARYTCLDPITQEQAFEWADAKAKWFAQKSREQVLRRAVEEERQARQELEAALHEAERFEVRYEVRKARFDRLRSQRSLG